MNYVMPFVAYNAIFYCITTLSTSISSTQNIFKFIVEHTDSDYVIWQHQLETTDLHNKLCITSALIKDIIKKHCIKTLPDKNKQTEPNENKQIDELVEELINPKYDLVNETESGLGSVTETEFTMVELVKKTSIDIIVPEPVKIALLSTLEVINKINNILEKIRNKILQHQKSYLKNIIKININDEVNRIINLTNLFNSRLSLLFELLKVYGNVLFS